MPPPDFMRSNPLGPGPVGRTRPSPLLEVSPGPESGAVLKRRPGLRSVLGGANPLLRTLLCALGLAVAAVAVGLLLSPWRSNVYDVDIMAQVTTSMLTNGTFRVPVDGFNGPYSTYGLGMSLVFIAPYWLALHQHGDPMSWLMASNVFVFALTIAAVFGLALGCGATRRQAAVTSFLVGFGTLLFPYAVTGFSELGVALGTAIGLAALTVTSRYQLGGAIAVGAAAGLTVLMRSDSLLLVAPILLAGAWLLGGRRGWPVLGYAAGIAPWLYAVGAYNALRFGAPWHLGYAGYLFFDHPLLKGLYGLVLSPNAGLLWYVPLVAVAVLGLPSAMRRLPVLTTVAIALVLIRLPFYGTFWAWNGGVAFGPRYLVPAVPALALGVLEVVRRFPSMRRSVRIAVPAIATLSILVQFVGATVDTQQTQLRYAAFHVLAAAPRGENSKHFQPDVVAALDEVSFDWRYFLIPDEANSLLHGRNLMSRFLVQRRAEAPLARGAQPHMPAVALYGLLFMLGLGLAWFASGESGGRGRTLAHGAAHRTGASPHG